MILKSFLTCLSCCSFSCCKYFGLFVCILLQEVLLFLGGHHPIIVNVILDFFRNVNFRVFFIPIEEEEVLVKYWLCWCLFSVFKLWSIAFFNCSLIISVFVQFVSVFNVKLILGILERSFSIIRSLHGFFLFL